ncbi:MAG: hypothetical protein J2P19_18225 [Pseudonocardia sp.]|nr:hypothetical protein [Pseudonocardia sp.]
MTCYAVSCVPEDWDAGDCWTVYVIYAGDGKWMVKRSSPSSPRGRYLDADRVWSHRTHDEGDYVEETWLAAHQFDEVTALRLAREAAQHLVMNGVSVTQLLNEGI